METLQEGETQPNLALLEAERAGAFLACLCCSRGACSTTGRFCDLLIDSHNFLMQTCIKNLPENS